MTCTINFRLHYYIDLEKFRRGFRRCQEKFRDFKRIGEVFKLKCIIREN